jgi:hypothetical protein
MAHSAQRRQRCEIAMVRSLSKRRMYKRRGATWARHDRHARAACNDVERAFGSTAMTERTQSIETGQGPIAFRIRCGVSEPARLPTPSGASASAMVLAMAGKAAMAPASPQPLTPSGLVVQQVLLSRGRMKAGCRRSRADRSAHCDGRSGLAARGGAAARMRGGAKGVTVDISPPGGVF